MQKSNGPASDRRLRPGWLTNQGIMSPPIFVSWDQYSSNDFKKCAIKCQKSVLAIKSAQKSTKKKQTKTTKVPWVSQWVALSPFCPQIVCGLWIAKKPKWSCLKFSWDLPPQTKLVGIKEILLGLLRGQRVTKAVSLLSSLWNFRRKYQKHIWLIAWYPHDISVRVTG